MKSLDSYKTLRLLRKELGYTQSEVSQWIDTDKSNYNKKEKGVVTVTADEFLTILSGLFEQGPSPKANKYLTKEANQFLKDTDGLAGAIKKLVVSHKKDRNQTTPNKDIEKMLDRYEGLIKNYIHMTDSLQERVNSLEAFITSNKDRTRKGDPENINVGQLRRNP